jgi:hypothetical protein
MQKIIAFTIAIALAANAQRIATEKSDRHKVIRVETAPNHLSVIELAEPVTEVAAGSSSYKIEWRGNKVFVQPLDPEATTNLFIWTASGRLSYELVPAPSVEEMHFAIDQEPSANVAKLPIPGKLVENARAVHEARLASEMLFASTPVRLAGEMKNHDRVEVILKDIYREGDRLYVRYAIQNRGRSTYVPDTPGVFTLRSRNVTLIECALGRIAGFQPQMFLFIDDAIDCSLCSLGGDADAFERAPDEPGRQCLA